jgi:hypothetical protein
MPSRILSPIINKIPEPTLEVIKEIANKFEVSMTSMMLRWVKLSHFPCGVFSVNPSGTIAWGWTSEPLIGIKSFWKNNTVASEDAKNFMASLTFEDYEEGTGKGLLSDWVKTPYKCFSVQEYYCIMPFFNSMLVFIFAYEDELSVLSSEE